MSAVAIELWHRVQQFLLLEARLLDERRFDEWLGLYAPGAQYWVPYDWQQKSPQDHVSLFYESVTLLRMRVDRLERELSPLDSPQARFNHHLTNIMVEQEAGGELTARAYLLFAEYRRDEQRWFSGRSTWRLRIAGPDFRIASKRIDLLNADQGGGHLRFAIPF